ncbi:exodeoxyribonuclease VII large subunit [Pseudogracilibacillus auburnensis]|uniref:exodeoxyribonuclease VII large subunit n=1 Tax=Pseudogracilibacillus auburnensis TaxID=1494959 RepID=UPI001A96C2BF|nr:exodeoxyribonuclease VII large subunit [Pseudogracilibacillus auburnensis]MBO1004301.1 exodeoxyribonuclease VII large subunit [Pseudogracilibacillus auburnensis]
MNERYLTVTALTRYIKKKLEMDRHLQEVWLKGEISNFTHHSRGHMYLTIKDNQTRIQAVMFAGNNRRLKFRPENGMNVLIKGEISVFESYGQYQLYIREMQPDGIGALYLAYEQLKERLSKDGYFDDKHKRQIPKFPSHIAVITSPTGAAVRDIITTIKRRFPVVQLTIIPVFVQGEEAAKSIQHAIIHANQMKGFDTIIVGRGGGSIEDLWSFNDEGVAKAIFHSKIPVISAIGHETDVTISDFVADLRAPTPTGAAELAVPSLEDLREHMNHLKARLLKLTQLTTMKKAESLQAIRQSYAFHLPKHLINEKEQYIDRLTEKLVTSYHSLQKTKRTTLEQIEQRLIFEQPQKKWQEAKQRVDNAKEALTKSSITKVQQKQHDIQSFIDKLTLLNPLHIMKRGFALPYTEKGTLIKTTEQLKINDQLRVRLLDGSFYCKVEKIRRDQDDKGK